MNWGPEATPRSTPTLCSGLTSPCHSHGDCEDSTCTRILASPSLQGGVLSTFLREQLQERRIIKDDAEACELSRDCPRCYSFHELQWNPPELYGVGILGTRAAAVTGLSGGRPSLSIYLVPGQLWAGGIRITLLFLF